MNLLYRTAHGLVRLCFKLFCHCEIVSHAKIPRSGAVIIAPNHTSYLDPPLVGSSIRRECRFMAQHNLWNKRWLGWIITRLGAFPVNREKPDRATFRSALKALEEGYALVMFPEGGRARDGTLQKGEMGIALFVQKSGAPVVPTALIGPEKMLPVGQSRLKRVPLKVVFGDPIFFTPDTPRAEIVSAIMRAIAGLLTAHGIPTVAKESPDSESPRTQDLMPNA